MKGEAWGLSPPSLRSNFLLNQAFQPNRVKRYDELESINSIEFELNLFPYFTSCSELRAPLTSCTDYVSTFTSKVTSFVTSLSTSLKSYTVSRRTWSVTPWVSKSTTTEL